MNRITVRPRSRTSGKRRDPKTITRFVEELSWVLDRYSDVDFKELAKKVEQSMFSPDGLHDLKEFAPRNQNALLLVGVLPGMFTDEYLFPSNEDIAEFAEAALNVTIPRWSKKSKHELIGHIVCSTAVADDARLSKIALALRKIAAGDHVTKHLISAARIQKKSWNEIIQQLIEQNK